MPTSSSVSASSIVAGIMSGTHTLKIVGYSYTKEVPSGRYLESSPFQVGGLTLTWRVRYYPNGWKSENIDSISFFIRLDDTLAEDETVKAQVKFSLLDQHGKPVPAYTKTTKIRDFSVENWGYERFITREELESQHLRDDSFTVKVHVSILSDFHAQETPIAPPIPVRPSDKHTHFGDLLSSKAGADVQLRVGRETFSAHRSVLAARSPVFKTQFFGPMKESAITNVIPIHDIEADVFSALLTFMYTDALPDMDQQEEHAMSQHMLVAADRYGLDRLKLICADKLTSGIDTSSVATILVLADRHHCSDLKAACFVFLGEATNLDEAIESEGFELLTKTSPGVIKDILKSRVIPSCSLWNRKSRA
ncbi:hypothetical protein ACQ4PT_001669 [Festuca glaucescens]